MSVSIPRLEDGIPLVPGMPEVSDLGDLWLVHALASLLDACGVPEAKRGKLIESGIDPFRPRRAKRAAPDEMTRLERLDSCRLAVVFAALALEARLNRILRSCNPVEWGTVAALTAPEKFGLSPQLLGRREYELEAEELFPLVVELFGVRDELVDGGDAPDSVLRLGPSWARAMVEASARLCSFVAALTGEGESGTAKLVHHATEALERRADALALIRSPSRPHREPSEDDDFPLDLAEW
jgi:hypothetical protein